MRSAGSTALRRRTAVPVLLPLVVGAGFVLRLWGLSHMHFWDENVYLLNAEYFFSGHAGYIEIDSRPPLLPLLFASVFHAWHSDYAALVVTALLNALAPAFLFLAGRKVVSTPAAAVAAMFLGFAPCLVGVCRDGSGGLIANSNGHSLMTDCPALTLIVVSFWLLLRALERQAPLRFALAGLAMALAVLMRFGSLSSVAMLFLLCLGARRPLRGFLAGGAGFILGMAPYLAWSGIHYGGFFETLRLGWLNLGGAPEPALYFIKDAPNMFSWLALFGLAAWLIIRILRPVPATSASAEATALCVTPRSAFYWQAFLLLWLAVILTFFSSLSHKEQRYDIPLAPPLFLLAGVGLTSFLSARNRTLRNAAIIALTSALLATFWPNRHRFDTGFFDPARSEEMIVSDFIRTYIPPSAVLYTNENYPDFAWYTGHTVEAISEDGPGLYHQLHHLPGGAVLIAYKGNDDDIGGPAEPPLSLLDSDPHFTRISEFPSLVLYAVNAPQSLP